MRSIVLVMVFLPFVIAVKAQKGNNNIHLMAEAGLAEDNAGFGGLAKGLYGVGKQGQLTFTAGVSKFVSGEKTARSNTRLVSFLLGYRQNLSKFYIEPQAGIGELGGKYNLTGDYSRPSVAAFIWSAAAGIRHRRIDIGLRYVSAKGIEGAEAGTWHDRKFRYACLHFGYALIR
jgi:hypothetical protein